ncbi:hypothetical protein CYMTET_37639 [Cymbomonas tetramitiformis]|uniref:Uncharacterized protein n=1 Tax=Cymbomonas tetramitiformis TaxID=36881 RepID=A0AAE0CF52_9CHLO|nr:hypothetical protein CYMTET_37639 [Cymbomonas tetramitiformis]
MFTMHRFDADTVIDITATLRYFCVELLNAFGVAFDAFPGEHEVTDLKRYIIATVRVDAFWDEPELFMRNHDDRHGAIMLDDDYLKKVIVHAFDKVYGTLCTLDVIARCEQRVIKDLSLDGSHTKYKPIIVMPSCNSV